MRRRDIIICEIIRHFFEWQLQDKRTVQTLKVTFKTVQVNLRLISYYVSRVHCQTWHSSLLSAHLFWSLSCHISHHSSLHCVSSCSELQNIDFNSSPASSVLQRRGWGGRRHVMSEDWWCVTRVTRDRGVRWHVGNCLHPEATCLLRSWFSRAVSEIQTAARSRNIKKRRRRVTCWNSMTQR